MSNILFFFRESAQVAYGGEQEGPFFEKDMVRAHFVVELNEDLGYPLSAIHVDTPLWVEGRGFQEAAVLVENQGHEIVIAAAVETPQEYERNQEFALRNLYLQAGALAKTRKVRQLVYYTRWYRNGSLKKRKIVVDYAAYPTYEAWQAAGCPSARALAAYGDTNCIEPA